MEYNYELLRKCHGLRFRATFCSKPQEGVIKVTSEGVILCYGQEDPGYLVTFGRRNTLSFSRETFAILPSDFEIVPRDPETYQDWQVGDVICGCGGNKEIIFRSGEVVVFKYPNGHASNNFTCRELFESGFRLVLTDIEEQIIEERKWKPQDGDICFAETGTREQRFIIIYYNNAYSLADFYGSGWKLRRDALWEYSRIRPATDEEKQKLFDAMAKEGKRWNAEKKVVEDIKGAGIPSFKRFDPVLVRMSDGCKWFPAVFSRCGEDGGDYPFYIITVIGDDGYNQCVPLNDRTEQLIDTTQKYEE